MLRRSEEHFLGSPCGKTVTRPNKKGCCELEGRSALERKACCSKVRSAASEQPSGNAFCRDLDNFAARLNRESDVGLDIAKGISFRGHISLSVDSLICTGCETKL